MQTQFATTFKYPSKSVKVKKEKSIKRLNRVQLLSFIVCQKGKFISVDYFKRDGVQRKLTGRLGVTKYLKGGQNNVESLERAYLVIFDIKMKEYRTISLDTLIQIRASNVIWNVFD